MEAEVRYSLLLLGTLLTTSGGNSAFAHYCEGDCAIRGTCIRTHLPRAASHEATFIVTFGDQLFGRLNVIDRCFLCTGVVFR